MIITPHFVYLHYPKTGGTFVTRMLHEMKQHNPGFSLSEPKGLKHSGRRRIPEAHAELPVVTNIRYLLDHYVSRYEFRWWTRPGFFRPEIKDDYPAFPDLDFHQFMQAFCDWRYRPIPADKAAQLNHSDIGVNTRAITRIVGVKNNIVLKKQDKMSNARVRELFEGIHFLKSHQLNQDLAELIQAFGKAEGINYDTDFILESGKVLPKLGGRGDGGKKWQAYFDDELIDMVLSKDRLLLRAQPWLLEEFPSGSRQRLDEIVSQQRKRLKNAAQ